MISLLQCRPRVRDGNELDSVAINKCIIILSPFYVKTLKQSIIKIIMGITMSTTLAKPGTKLFPSFYFIAFTL